MLSILDVAIQIVHATLSNTTSGLTFRIFRYSTAITKLLTCIHYTTVDKISVITRSVHYYDLWLGIVQFMVGIVQFCILAIAHF